MKKVSSIKHIHTLNKIPRRFYEMMIKFIVLYEGIWRHKFYFLMVKKINLVVAVTGHLVVADGMENKRDLGVFVSQWVNIRPVYGGRRFESYIGLWFFSCPFALCKATSLLRETLFAVSWVAPVSRVAEANLSCDVFCIFFSFHAGVWYHPWRFILWNFSEKPSLHQVESLARDSFTWKWCNFPLCNLLLGWRLENESDG